MAQPQLGVAEEDHAGIEIGRVEFDRHRHGVERDGGSDGPRGWRLDHQGTEDEGEGAGDREEFPVQHGRDFQKGATRAGNPVGLRLDGRKGRSPAVMIVLRGDGEPSARQDGRPPPRRACGQHADFRMPLIPCVCVPLLARSTSRLGDGAAQIPDRPSLQVVRCVEPPTIDGKLDDPAWSLARPVDAFVQVEPREGEAPTERTEIRALYDADHLYLGIRCFDREPAAIIATQMRRDADLDTDDRVLIVLDTFEDRRNGYLFEMNPAGARLDALIGSNGEDLNESWDTIWEGRAAIDGEGWSIELAIPFKSLSFRPDLASWGFNVQRVIKRRLENDRWASPRRNLSIAQVSEAGTLAGLAGIRQGIGLDLVPFFSTHWNEDDSGNSTL